MKKMISLLLAFVLCLSLCACGKTVEDIKKDVSGVWSYSWYASAVNMDCCSVYIFSNDGKVTHFTVRGDNHSEARYGTYKVQDKNIAIDLDGNEIELDVAYKGNTLTLINTGDGSARDVYEQIDFRNMPDYTATQDYAEILEGQEFVAEGGQTLSFYGSGKAAYDFTNGVGEHYHYEFEYVVGELDFATATIALMNTDTCEVEFATLDPSQGKIDFYANTYFVK